MFNQLERGNIVEHVPLQTVCEGGKNLIKAHILKVFNFTAHELHYCKSTCHYNMAE
jgi:hypothetical protein